VKCAAVIPCFNESNTIAPVVSALQRYLDFVIVVDDGSTDKTALKAKKAGATVIHHKQNCGKGAALRTGLSELLNQGFEWAVMLDGDGQHAPADLSAFLECAEQTGAPLIIGNRMHAADTMPRVRRWANRWMSRKLSRYAQCHLPDTQSGFRLIHLPTWASLDLNARHFEVESEMLMAFLAAKHPVEFVPIRVIPGGRTSRIHPIVDSLRWLKWWRKMKQNSAAQPALKISKPPCAMAAAQEM
jgi:glycosyltransferase involved in cell wall biosynthesis